MIRFFRWPDWRVHARTKPVDESTRIAECKRLLTEPWTEEDRRLAEQATRAYLASVEAGC